MNCHNQIVYSVRLARPSHRFCDDENEVIDELKPRLVHQHPHVSKEISDGFAGIVSG